MKSSRTLTTSITSSKTVEKGLPKPVPFYKDIPSGNKCKKSEIDDFSISSIYINISHHLHIMVETRGDRHSQMKKSKNTSDITTNSANDINIVLQELPTISETQIEISPSASTETLTDDKPDWPTDNWEESNFITEEMIKELGWKIYNSYDQELRAKLHIEYLNKYIEADIIPKGLTIKLMPSIQDDNLISEWNNVLNQASKNIMKVLIKHYEKKLVELNAKRNEINADMDKYWDEEEKVYFIEQINDGIEKREESLRRMKDQKIERDRKLTVPQTTTKTRKTPTSKTTNKTREQYATIAKRHIKEQLQNPKKSSNRNSHGIKVKSSYSDALKRGFFENASRNSNGNEQRDNSNNSRTGSMRAQGYRKRQQYRGQNFRNSSHKENNHTRYSSW